MANVRVEDTGTIELSWFRIQLSNMQAINTQWVFLKLIVVLTAIKT